MSVIVIAGGVCIALALMLALFNAGRSETHRPCAFCGKLLAPPLYACTHYLGDGREWRN